MCAVIVNGYAPTLPAAGFPLSAPDIELSVTPAGRTPASENVGAGEPVAVTANAPCIPMVKVALFPLVITAGEAAGFAFVTFNTVFPPSKSAPVSGGPNGATIM